jgi:type II secretory pathway pseudopilin PulG
MLPFTKQLICPSRSDSAGGAGADSGYALLFVMIAATILLISLTVALPSIYQEGRREREQELIFRGRQYARAIASFHQKFQRYPTSVGELTKLTNGWRFLRKEFSDPMTPDGKWRFIHVNAQGVLLDSKAYPAPGSQGQPGAGQGAGGFGMSGPSGTGGSGFGQQGMGGNGFGQQGMGGSGFGQQGMGGSGFGQQGMGGSGFGQQGMGGSGFGQQGMGGSGFGQQGASGSGFGQSAGGSSLSSNSSGSTSSGQMSSGFLGAGNQGGGTFIAGVASTSHKQSIRTWNSKTHYDEWEFIGVDLGALGFATSIPGLPQGATGQPSQGGQPNSFGQSSGFSQQGNPTTPGQNQSMFPPSGGSTSAPQ